MKQNIFLKIASIFLMLQILFGTIVPAVVYAQENPQVDPGTGGQEPAPTQQSAPTDAPVVNTNPEPAAPAEAPEPEQSVVEEQNAAAEQAVAQAPPAVVEPEPEAPQEPDVAQAAQTPEQPAQTTSVEELQNQINQYEAQGNQAPPELVTQLLQTQAQVEQQQAAQAPETEQEKAPAETYQQEVQQDPVVDTQTQDKTLEEYSQAAQQTVSSSDQSRQKSREELEELSARYIAEGNRVPDEITRSLEAFGSGVSNGATAVSDSVQGVFDNQDEASLAKKAEEAQKLADAQNQQQQKTLDELLALSPQERAAQLKQSLGLPPETSSEDLVKHINSSLPESGIQLSGDVDNIVLTNIGGPRGTSSVKGEKLISDISPSGKQVDDLASKLGDFLVSMGSAGTSDLVKAGAQSLKGDLPHLEELKGKAGVDTTRPGTLDEMQRLAGLSEDEINRLINGEVVNGIAPVGDADQIRARKEYADALVAFNQKSEDLQQDAKILGALIIVGGPVGEEASGVVGNVAKPFLKRLGESVSGTLGRLLGREGEQAGESAVKAVLNDGVPVFAQTFSPRDAFKATIGTRQTDGFSPLASLMDHPQDIIIKAIKLRNDIFEGLTPSEQSEELVSTQTRVLAEWLNAGKSEAEIKASFIRAQNAIQDVVNHNGFLDAVDQTTRETLLTQRYGTRLQYVDPSGTSYLLDIADSLMSKENADKFLKPKVDDAIDVLVALRRYATDNGADKESFRNILEATNSNNIHISTPAQLARMVQPGQLAEEVIPYGLYNPADKQLLINYQGATTHTVTHECIHAACGITGDWGARYNALTESLGSKDNVNKLTEGLTEWTTLKGEQLAGKDVGSFAYGQQVNAVERIIEKMQEGGFVLGKGLSRPEAESKVIEAAVSGYYGKLYEPLGKGDAEKGREILVRILDATPKTDTNVTSSALSSQVLEKIVVLTPVEKAVAVTAATAAGGTTEYFAGKAILNAIQQKPKESKQLPYNFNFINKVHAQTKKQSPGSVVNTLLKVELAKTVLKRDGSINKEELSDISRQNAVDPTVIQTTDGYVFMTGEDGTVNGKLLPGEYMIQVPQYKVVGLSTPQALSIKDGKTILAIGIKPNSNNKAIKTKTSYRINIDAHAADNKEKQVETITFYDQNSNGKWDSSEHAVPWAGVQVELKKVNQEKLVNFNSGWNLFTLTAVPSKPLTASDLIQEIAKQGGYATTVSTLENDSWKSFVVRGDKNYSGENFTIEPGKAYFVKNLKKSIFLFEGQELASPIKVKLASGWNAVGFPKTSGSHKIGDLLDSARPLSAEGYEGARWESGLWDSFVKQNAQAYGENFAIEPNRGYIIKVNKETEISP